jgi:dehydratase
MRERRLPVFGVLAVGTAVVLAYATALPVGASTTVSTSHQCTASALGQTQTATQNDDVVVTAPTSAAAGSTFQVVLAPQPQTVPSQSGNFTVKSIKNLTLKVTFANATVSGTPTLSGGSSNLGTTGVSVSGNQIVTSASGPIQGGASFTLDTLTVNFVAGTAGSPATTSLVGTSSASTTDLHFTTVVQAGPFTVNADTSCVPNPNPTGLSSTSVT